MFHSTAHQRMRSIPLPTTATLVRLAVASGAAALTIGLTGCTADEPPGDQAASAPAGETTSAETDPLEALVGTWRSVPAAGADMATQTLVINVDSTIEYTGATTNEGTLVLGSEDTHQIETTDYTGEPDTWVVVYDAEADTLEVTLTYVTESSEFVFERTG